MNRTSHELSSRRAAMSAGTAILLGYFSIAIAFGVSGRSIGLPAVAVAGFSVFVFAGASQFVAVGLLAQGAGALSIIAATLVLNSRHIVMSMSLRDRIVGSRIPRPVLAFGITDEVFTAAATRPGEIQDTDLLVSEALAYSGWIGGTVVGFLIGSVLPSVMEDAMGIALYAMFVALIVPAVLRFPRYLVPALAAGGCNWALQAIGVPVGIALLVSIGAVAALFAVSPRWSES
ncbi:MAG: AzlC family ABC transporter permease [Spirochaetota bacterium]